MAMETADAFGPRTLVFLIEGVGQEDERPVWGEERTRVFIPAPLNGHAAWECHLHLGQPGQQSQSLTFIYLIHQSLNYVA